MPDSRRLEGRTDELAALTRLVSDVAAGRGGALVVRGAAGIGKSALLDAARSRALARRIGIAAFDAVPAEAGLRLAAVEAVVRALDAHVVRVGRLHRSVLRTIAAGGVPPVLAAVLALRALLHSAGRAHPVLVLVDDDQWLDPASLTVFAGVARRLAGTPAGLVLAGRPRGGSDVLRVAALTVVVPAPLRDRDAERIVATCRPELASDERAWVLSKAAGNPLALRTLEPPETVMPAPPVGPAVALTAPLQRSLSAPFAELGRPCRDAVVLAAADESATVGEILAAAAPLHGPCGPAVLEPAVRAGLVTLDGTSVRFVHPLTASAAYFAASAETRAAAHAALASVISDDTDRRTWHRAAACLGRDARVACALEVLANRAVGRGSLRAKIAALARAAELSPHRPVSGDLLLTAADLAFDAGDRRLVRQLLEAAGRHTADDPRWDYVASRFDDGMPGDGGAIAGTEPKLLWRLARRCRWTDPGPSVRCSLADAIESAAPRHDAQRAAALGLTAPERHHEIAAAVATAAACPRTGRTALLLGSAACVYDDDLAFVLLSEAVSGLRREGADGLLAQAHALRAWAGIATTRFATAAEDAQLGVLGAERSGQMLWAARSRAAIALLAGLRGEIEVVEQQAAQAERTALAAHASAVLADVQLARGRAALAEGRQDEAFTQLRRIFVAFDPAGHRLRSLDALVDLAEAAMMSERVDEARELIAARAEETAALGSARWRAGLAAAHALLAEDADLPSAFAAAQVALPAGASFDRARLMLAQARRLRRQRRILASRELLRPVIEAFEGLGADAWAEHARRELRATGISARRRSPSTRGDLTAQELQIARLAALGLSNREIGERLFLSPRTIGSHLYRIYPKLGIASRNELSAVLAETSQSAA